MNLVEFNALKPGDKIENAMSNSTGEVVEVDKHGVKVRWYGVGMTDVGMNGLGAVRTYSRASTIWFHWSKPEAEEITKEEMDAIEAAAIAGKPLGGPP
jgi:hypothetical protein